jgi:hypothetical protein
VFSPPLYRPDVVSRQDRRHVPADRAHPHAGVRRAPVASPGDSARFCSAPARLPSAWSICGDKGLGLTPTASALPSQCYCGNDGPRRLRRRKLSERLAASRNHPRRTNSSSEQLIARFKCVNRIFMSGRYSLSAAMIACQKSIPRHATTRMRRIRPRASRPKVLSSCELSRSGSLMRNYSVARQRAKLTRH